MTCSAYTPLTIPGSFSTFFPVALTHLHGLEWQMIHGRLLSLNEIWRSNPCWHSPHLSSLLHCGHEPHCLHGLPDILYPHFLHFGNTSSVGIESGIWSIPLICGSNWPIIPHLRSDQKYASAKHAITAHAMQVVEYPPETDPYVGILCRCKRHVYTHNQKNHYILSLSFSRNVIDIVSFIPNSFRTCRRLFSDMSRRHMLGFLTYNHKYMETRATLALSLQQARSRSVLRVHLSTPSCFFFGGREIARYTWQ